MNKPPSPVKFLLVDDLEENLLVLEALLRREGLELMKAHSGREALELALTNEFALALIDVQMPEMDGFELAELMRGAERTRHVPIIFVTAGIQERHRIFKGYDAGAVDFLFKPLEPQILRHKTETFFQLHRQRQELAETLRLNEELMAVVGHDLKNPLNVVLMTTNLLAESSDPLVQKCVPRLSSSGARMVQIIDELFDLSRARLGGGIPIERQPSDLEAIARKTVAELEATNPNHKFAISVEGDVHGDWDAGRLGQVLSNLVGNAVRHGNVTAPITVRLSGARDDVEVSVHNAGHVPEDLIPRLFQPFQSGLGRRTRAEGLGLGLYIVQQIVIAHGGEVRVSSTPTDGTTFLIRLPRHA
ncbi:MAG TPA: hybrid sensor histidine kinase/response regulator [Polyangiaceae bacterium]|jgi:signal transduction histidine kinase|nr:hybrid sensor histidine kinase/response regulator [Polyangiaceae bacterium]